MKKRFIFLVAVIVALARQWPLLACTGITLHSKDSACVLARTIEWGGSDLNSRYVIVPRGYKQQSFLPSGKTNGMEFSARYGYVGLSVQQKDFVVEGLNETGLSAGLFYFPGYGKYEEYNEALCATSITDLQLVSWVLGNFKTVSEVKEGIKNIHVIAIDPRASTVHWRFADVSGSQLVLEIVNGKFCFYDNTLGVLTNSPGFEWQMTNLNNYVNLYPGSAKTDELRNLKLAPFGAGSGFLGLPGDVTPPSRFVRAAFHQSTAPQQNTALETVLQGFQILNNFDIPIGIEFSKDEDIADIPSATQWTSVTDLKNRKIYYRTMYNSAIRCIDLNTINFGKIKYRDAALDSSKLQPVHTLNLFN